MTDLARELEKVLPCHDPDWCDSVGCADPEYPSPPDPCPSCYYRPAILAYVQRKLEEARADSELLAKVEGYIRRHEYLPDCTYIRESGGFYLAGLERGYPTLVEALRKLVAES